MTRAQKQELAFLLLSQAGNLVEFWGEHGSPIESELSADDVAEQLTVWLKTLPSDVWDSRLPLPN